MFTHPILLTVVLVLIFVPAFLTTIVLALLFAHTLPHTIVLAIMCRRKPPLESRHPFATFFGGHLPRRDRFPDPRSDFFPRGYAVMRAAFVHAFAHGRDLLDMLEQVRLGLLLGRVPEAQLHRIVSRLEARHSEFGDPRIDQIIREIETRAAVELAKFDKIREQNQ